MFERPYREMVPHDLWERLSGPWQACVELAWEAYRAGSLPIGAVVAARHGIRVLVLAWIALLVAYLALFFTKAV